MFHDFHNKGIIICVNLLKLLKNFVDNLKMGDKACGKPVERIKIMLTQVYIINKFLYNYLNRSYKFSCKITIIFTKNRG